MDRLKTSTTATDMAALTEKRLFGDNNETHTIDRFVLRILAAQPVFQADMLVRVGDWWVNERLSGETLGTFLERQGVVPKGMVDKCKYFTTLNMDAGQAACFFTLTNQHLRVLRDKLGMSSQTDTVHSLAELREGRTGPKHETTVTIRPTESPLRGQFGRYRLRTLIHHGSSGRIFESEDVSTGALVALKVLPVQAGQDDLAIAELLNDLYQQTSVTKLPHVNCLGLLAVGHVEGMHYLARPLIEGKSGADLLREKGPLPPADATRICKLAARGLAAAHTARIYHGDVRPAHILLGNDGNVKLADFGLVDFHARCAALQGGPRPNAQPEVRVLTDVIGLAETYYELLAGKPPHPRNASTDPKVTMRENVLQLPAGIPETCRSFLARAFGQSPEERYRSAGEMAAAFQTIEQLAALLQGVTPPTSRPLSNVPARAPAAKSAPSVGVKNLQPGMTLSGKYLLEEQIGKGGSGVVFKATHLSLHKPVAIKVLRSGIWRNDGEAFDKFKTEARMLAKLDHPNIVRVTDFDDNLDCPYFVMDYVEGNSLATLITQAGKLPVDQTIKIIAQVLEGLHCVWDAGIVHRDVTPANILLTSSGIAKLTDLGLAVFANAMKLELHEEGKEGNTSDIVGTLSYLSPEQVLRKPLDLRSDIYSLGVTFYHAITGHVPFTGTWTEVLRHHCSTPPKAPEEWVRGLDPLVSHVIMTMMAKDAKLRFQNYAALQGSLSFVGNSL